MTRFFPVVLVVLLAIPARSKDASWEATSRLPLTLEAPLADDPMGVTIHRLANGLTVYLSPNKQTPRITARVAVRAGGSQDPRDSTGMAHYLEHMLFKGSSNLGTSDFSKEKVHLDRIQKLYEDLFTEVDLEKRKAIYAEIDRENQEAAKYGIPSEFDKAFKTLGMGDMNAHTFLEQTVYEGDLPKNRLEAWAKLEGERFSRPVFRFFQTEIETVYEELNRSMDNPGSIVWHALLANIFKGHPYEVPVIGTIEHLKNPSLRKMYEFYDRYYVPNNMAVALAGDFERAEALATLERYFGEWKPRALPAEPRPAVERSTSPRRVELRYEAEEQGLAAWLTAPVNHADEAALVVMDMVASNAQSGLIDLRLNQRQLLKTAGSEGLLANDAGMWLVQFSPKEGQTLEQAEALVMEVVEALKKGDFSEEDLKANVLNYEIMEKMKLESNEARAGAMYSAFLQFDDWSSRSKRLERLRKVTKEDVVRVANAYLGEGRVVIYRRKGKPEIPSIKKPGFTPVSMDAARESKFLREVVTMPAVPIEPKWVVKGVDYVERRIPGGKLVWSKNPMNDLFALSVSFERGRRHERRLCAALELAEKAGGGDLPPEAFKRRLYELGVTMDFSCGERSSGYSLSGPEANLEAALALLRQRLEAPVVEPGTLEKMVEIWVGQHKDNKLNPGSLDRALTEWSERGAESGVLSETTDAELKALKEPELKALLRDFPAWERRVTYVGARDADSVAGLLKEKREYRPRPESVAVKYVRPPAPRVVFLNRDMVQSKVGLYAADGDFDPALVLEGSFYRGYMGDGFSSVIFQEVREARSLAYSAWGGYASGGRLGDGNRFLGRLGTQADKTVEAVELMLELIRQPPWAEGRFKETKEAILQTYRTDPLTFRQVPGAVLAWEDQGLGKDPRPARFKAAQSYSMEDLKRFAARVKDKPFTVHIMGHKERIDFPALKKFGDVVEKQVDELFPY